MTIDASNVSIRTEAFDPDTGTIVVTVDGVETERIPAPEQAAAYERQRRLDALLDLDPAVIAAATEKVAAVEKALVDKAVLTAKDITDAVVAEPVDEEAVVKP